MHRSFYTQQRYHANGAPTPYERLRDAGRQPQPRLRRRTARVGVYVCATWAEVWAGQTVPTPRLGNGSVETIHDNDTTTQQREGSPAPAARHPQNQEAAV